MGRMHGTLAKAGKVRKHQLQNAIFLGKLNFKGKRSISSMDSRSREAELS